MDVRERINAFWNSERPDVIPYSIYSYEYDASGCAGSPEWLALHENGLGVTLFANTFAAETPSLETRTETSVEDGSNVTRHILSTPVGDIHQTLRDDWHDRYLIETPEDYRVMTWIAENTRVEPDHENFFNLEKSLPPWYIVIPRLGRTPLQTILVDYVGLENFGYHLIDYPDDMMALYAALLKVFRRMTEITAAGPGRYVEVLENFTAETLGPKRYEEFLLPVYQECFPLLHQAGKIVGTHYDGQTASCKDLIARAPIDLIESLTTPPEGDLSLAEARAAWPDKLFWSNLNVGAYQLPEDMLRALVLDRVTQAAPDGRLLAFEVSEHLPRNWQSSIPIVLDTLNHARP